MCLICRFAWHFLRGHCAICYKDFAAVPLIDKQRNWQMLHKRMPRLPLSSRPPGPLSMWGIYAGDFYSSLSTPLYPFVSVKIFFCLFAFIITHIFWPKLFKIFSDVCMEGHVLHYKHENNASRFVRWRIFFFYGPGCKASLTCVFYHPDCQQGSRRGSCACRCWFVAAVNFNLVCRVWQAAPPVDSLSWLMVALR